jgi:hypothetical protein
MLHLLTAGCGTQRRFAAVQQVVGYWKCCGPSARVLGTAVHDPGCANKTHSETQRAAYSITSSMRIRIDSGMARTWSWSRSDGPFFARAWRLSDVVKIARLFVIVAQPRPA